MHRPDPLLALWHALLAVLCGCLLQALLGLLLVHPAHVDKEDVVPPVLLLKLFAVAPFWFTVLWPVHTFVSKRAWVWRWYLSVPLAAAFGGALVVILKRTNPVLESSMNYSDQLLFFTVGISVETWLVACVLQGRRLKKRRGRGIPPGAY